MLHPEFVGMADHLNLVLRGSGDAVELAAFAADGRQIMAATAKV
ncbi:hypothetical protein [Sphingopyxis sp.]|nr:hypothetical protein [Sphingopyxis sp.]